MKHVSNEQKAKELGEKYIEKFFSPNVYSIERCLLDMAQWKDEQFAKEKKEIDEQWKRLMAESKSIGVDLLQCKDEQFSAIINGLPQPIKDLIKTLAK